MFRANLALGCNLMLSPTKRFTVLKRICGELVGTRRYMECHMIIKEDSRLFIFVIDIVCEFSRVWFLSESSGFDTLSKKPRSPSTSRARTRAAQLFSGFNSLPLVLPEQRTTHNDAKWIFWRLTILVVAYRMHRTSRLQNCNYGTSYTRPFRAECYHNLTQIIQYFKIDGQSCFV